MNVPTRSTRRRLAGFALVAAIACSAAPIATQAATPVNLATAQSFVVLAGATVTNTGPSVLNGDLGVAPGTALVGFGLPAVVNGATHSADAVAAQAQLDLTTAYNVAAGQAVSHPPTTSRAPTSATGCSRPAPTASRRRPSSRARSRSMPRAIRPRSSCSRSHRR